MPQSLQLSARFHCHNKMRTLNLIQVGYCGIYECDAFYAKATLSIFDKLYVHEQGGTRTGPETPIVQASAEETPTQWQVTRPPMRLLRQHSHTKPRTSRKARQSPEGTTTPEETEKRSKKIIPH